MRDKDTEYMLEMLAEFEAALDALDQAAAVGGHLNKLWLQRFAMASIETIRAGVESEIKDWNLNHADKIRKCEYSDTAAEKCERYTTKPSGECDRCEERYQGRSTAA